MSFTPIRPKDCRENVFRRINSDSIDANAHIKNCSQEISLLLRNRCF